MTLCRILVSLRSAKLEPIKKSLLVWEARSSETGGGDFQALTAQAEPLSSCPEEPLNLFRVHTLPSHSGGKSGVVQLP